MGSLSRSAVHKNVGESEKAQGLSRPRYLRNVALIEGASAGLPAGTLAGLEILAHAHAEHLSASSVRLA